MSNLVFSDLVYSAKYHITVVRPYNGKKCLGLNVQIGTLYDDQINFECLDVFKTRKNYLQRISEGRRLRIPVMYSRVQKSWNEVFFKILKKPSIVQKKMIPHIKGLDFSQR